MIKDLKKYDFRPIRSSFVRREKEKENIKSNSGELSMTNSFDFKIYSQSPAEIMNLYQELILNSKWDAREAGDYQNIILGRNHMFYTLPQTITIEVEDYKKYNKILEPIKEFNLNFLNEVNEKNINELDNLYLYDYGTYMHYKSNNKQEKIKEDERVENLNKLLYRKDCRKFSERHFAISGFNLVTHSISVNSEVPNTASSFSDGLVLDARNSVSIIPDAKEEYIKEIMVEPIVPPVSLEVDKFNKPRNTEFLANALLDQIKYVYQGSIIIKFNADVEIGDTIVLIDNVNSVFGIFEIDSYEHVLDQRGLLTNLVVKSSWEIKDPFLDIHSKEIGYKLLNNFIKKNSNKNERFSYISSLYLKYLTQAPKYASFYKKKKESIFNTSTIENGNVAPPTANMIRFYPMFIKGKIQIPQNLEPAFSYVTSNNLFQNIIFEVMKSLEIIGYTAFNKIKTESYKFLIFTLDILFSTITFNASEFFKPFLGMSSDKAKKGTYDESKRANYEEFQNIMEFTPYDEKYSLMYDYDFTIGFFNSRSMKIKDLYKGTNKEENDNNTSELYNNKVSVLKNMSYNLFDFICIVELYDSFKFKNETHETFFNNIKNENKQKSHLVPISENQYGTEYAGLIANNSCFRKNFLSNNGGNFVYKEIMFGNADNRAALEVEFDITNLNIDKINKLKVIFLHNYYGDINKANKDVYEERRYNIKNLLEKYKADAFGDTTAVAIIGDFNLAIYNSNLNPQNTAAEDINEIFRLSEATGFKSKISRRTTLKSNGYDYNKPFDNVLVSINIADKVDAKAYVYPEENKLSISDHIPVYLGLKKIKG